MALGCVTQSVLVQYACLEVLRVNTRATMTSTLGRGIKLHSLRAVRLSPDLFRRPSAKDLIDRRDLNMTMIEIL